MHRRGRALAAALALAAVAGCAKSDNAARDLALAADGMRAADSRADARARADQSARDATQDRRDASVSLRFGALSDVHAAQAKLTALVAALVARQPAFIVVLGDLASAKEGIVAALTTVAASKLPVYVIAGNIETREAHRQALQQVAASHGNVTDLSPHGSFKHAGVTFVALAGYHLSQWLPDDGFLYGQPELAAVEQLVGGANGSAVVLLTHGPPKSSGTHGIDYVPGAGNVGDEALRQLIDNKRIPFTICGHIHEAGQRAVDEADRSVAEGSYAPRLYLNAAAVTDGRASLVEIEAGRMRFLHLE